MRAIQIETWTTPDRLRPTEIAPPACAAGQVLIEVHAAAVSYSLSLLVQGKYQRKPALPFVPGNTVAGFVTAVGDGATPFKVGDRVVASLEFGALAELAVAHQANVFAIPDSLSFVAATSFNTSYNSVAAALTWPHLLNVQPGQTLLVTGAAGGTGTAAIQIGKLLGARVIAAASNDDKRAYALRQGADVAVDSDAAHLRDAVMKETAGQGVAAALEPVGGATFDAALRCMAPQGRILPLGFAGGTIPQIPANLLLVKNVTVCGLYMGYYKIDAREQYAQTMAALFAQLGTWWQQGLIKPVISACLPLDRIAEAFELVLDRNHLGHVVITMGDSRQTEGSGPQCPAC